jgi:hypothetical protein
MGKYTQSFWRLFCLSFAKKMTKRTLRKAFNGNSNHRKLKGEFNHGERRENKENTEKKIEN